MEKDDHQNRRYHAAAQYRYTICPHGLTFFREIRKSEL
jgi:hypothetical protein